MGIGFATQSALYGLGHRRARVPRPLGLDSLGDRRRTLCHRRRRWSRGSVDALACLPRAGQNCSQCRATEARYDRSQHIPQHVRMGNPVEIDMVCVRALFVLCHHEVLSVLELSVSSRMLRRRGKTFVDPESLHVYGCSIYVDGTLDNLETTYKYKLNLG